MVVGVLDSKLQCSRIQDKWKSTSDIIPTQTNTDSKAKEAVKCTIGLPSSILKHDPTSTKLGQLAITQLKISFASWRTRAIKRKHRMNQHNSTQLKIWRCYGRRFSLWYGNLSRTLVPLSRGIKRGMVFIRWQHLIILVSIGTMETIETASDKGIHHPGIEKKSVQVVCADPWGHGQLVFWIRN